jgi:hypothetical protein
MNRIFRWTSDGILLEADPRHQEILVAAERGSALLTPGAKETVSEPAEDVPLDTEAVSAFRSEAARGNYLGLDRPDIAFAAKELCRRMYAPDRASLRSLQRLVC